MDTFPVLSKVIDIVGAHRGHPYAERLGLPASLAGLGAIGEATGDHRFRALFLGEFNTGKSTLINALIGRDLLPASMVPTTFNVVEVAWEGREEISVFRPAGPAEGHGPQVAEVLPLAKQHLQELSARTPTPNLRVSLPGTDPRWGRFVLIDTPGTNDPSRQSEAVIFGEVARADVVVFLMSCAQAGKNTELEVLARITRSVDIDRFYFGLTRPDAVPDPKALRIWVARQLAATFGRDFTSFDPRVLLLSPIKGLDASLAQDSEGRHQSGLAAFEEALLSLVEENKSELIAGAVHRGAQAALAPLLARTEAELDRLDGKANRVLEAAKTVQAEVAGFRRRIEPEVVRLRRELDHAVEDWQRYIQTAFVRITATVSKEIDDLREDKLHYSRYVELRCRKLVEDCVADSTRDLLSAWHGVLQDFDRDIAPTCAAVRPRIDAAAAPVVGRNLVRLSALVGGVAVGGSVVPYVGGAVGGASLLGGLGAVAPVLATIPWVGPALAPLATFGAAAVPVIGLFVAAAGKILFDVAKWAYEKGQRIAAEVERKVIRAQYKSAVRKELDRVRDDILRHRVSPEAIADAVEKHVRAKFPEQAGLEAKVKALGELQARGANESAVSRAEVQTLRDDVRICLELLKLEANA